MTPRFVWFIAGTAAGVYGAAKARRAAYRLSAPGLVDQAAALGEGWRAFSAEMADGMQAREQDIARTLMHNSSLSTPGLEQAPVTQALPNKKAN